jgi:hypothetical protein
LKANFGAGCSITSGQFAPANQCVAFTSLSDGHGNEGGAAGCWTANR